MWHAFCNYELLKSFYTLFLYIINIIDNDILHTWMKQQCCLRGRTFAKAGSTENTGPSNETETRGPDSQ